MKYIDRLIQGAPVEWCPLGEVAEIKRGSTVTKKSSNVGEYPVISGGQQPAYYIDRFNRTGLTITIAGSGAYAGFVMYWEEPIFVSDAFSIKADETQLSLRYTYHYLLSLQSKIYQLKSGGGVPHVYPKDVARLLIPIPPVAVQEEVVRVLDKFTALEAELDCRKRQYGYYRDALLTFDLSPSDGLCHSPLFPVPFAVEWHPLGEVGEFTRGSGLQKKDFTTEGVGCIHYGQIYTHYGTFAFETKTFVSEEFAQKARKAQCGDLVIATTSENDEDLCKAVAWLGKEEVVVSSDACFYTHKMAPKYVSYFFQSTHFQKQKRTFITGTKVRRVNAKDLAKIEIPIPPLAVQERIVEILDKFDTLVNSISEGLPREIELRRKQYEYYRDALLSF